jgi:hypothetical protein
MLWKWSSNCSCCCTEGSTDIQQGMRCYHEMDEMMMLMMLMMLMIE